MDNEQIITELKKIRNLTILFSYPFIDKSTHLENAKASLGIIRKEIETLIQKIQEE